MTDTKPNYPPIRRVVTGHEGEVAKVMIDAPATNAKYPGAGNGIDHDLVHRQGARRRCRSARISRTWARAFSAPRRRRRALALP